MEEDKTQVTYEIIKLLINESQWGREVTVSELLGYLYDEIDEFAMGCCKKENENILEEAADVLMLILYILEKKNNGGEKNTIDILLRNINKKLQSRYAVFFGDSGDDEEVH